MRVTVKMLKGFGIVKVLESDKGEFIMVAEYFSDELLNKIIKVAREEKDLSFEKGLMKGVNIKVN